MLSFVVTFLRPSSLDVRDIIIIKFARWYSVPDAPLKEGMNVNQKTEDIHNTVEKK